MKPTKPFILEIRKHRMGKRKPRNKPTDPAEIAQREAANRRDPSKWGLNAEALALPANADVEADSASLKNVSRAQRLDVFSLFYRQGDMAQPAYEAVRRLQDDMAVLHRTAGTSGTSGIRLVGGNDNSELATILAGQRIEKARNGTGAHSWRILTELLEPAIVEGKEVNWRASVESTTGERNAMAQGALVRAAACNLAEHYAKVDREPRRASA